MKNPEKSGWVFPACELCGESGGEDLLAIKHHDAPEGVAFIRQCRGCGLKRLYPRPGEGIIQKYYASDYGAYIGRRRSPLKQAFWDLIRDGASGAPGRGRTLRPLRPFFRILANSLFDINVPLDQDPLPHILDIGCGFGDLLFYWQSRGAETLGVDFDERAVETATKLGLHVLLGDIKAQNIPPDSFDMAILNHSLEHFPYPGRILQHVASLLKKGGRVFITVPNGGSSGFKLEKQAWVALCFPVHFYLFDSHTLYALLTKTGFTNIKLKTSNMWRHRLARLKLTSRYNDFISILRILQYKLADMKSGDLINAVAIRK